MNTFRVKVLEIQENVPNVFFIRLERPKNFKFQAGQFIFIKKIVNQIPAIRAYSISTTPQQKEYFELCVKKVSGGKVSPILCSLKKNQILEFKGPAGRFTLDKDIKGELVLAATGTGISAIKGILVNALETGFKNQIYLFFGVKTQKHIIYRKELEKLDKNYKNFHFIPVLSRENWVGEKGHVQDPIKKYAKKLNLNETHMFICGIPLMVQETKKLALKLGFQEENMHFERC